MAILALDLGTSAFKAAVVRDGEIAAVDGAPQTAPYSVDQEGDRVICSPERYWRAALDALTRAADAAGASCQEIRAVGIASQAQTYAALDRDDHPLGPFVVWTDTRAEADAASVAAAIPDFARQSGMRRPTGQLLLPKLLHLRRTQPDLFAAARRFVLLNEYLALRLTGHAYGDETNQGMGGLYDIARRHWSPASLDLAGIGPDRLARVAPAARLAHPLLPDVAAAIGIDPVPVYCCGNDQSAAAAGAGLERHGDILANFGTAMVVYSLRDEPAREIADDQMAGISPLTGRYFLLAVESECGNVLAWLARTLFIDGDVDAMLGRAVRWKGPRALAPRVSLPGGGRVDLAGISIDCGRVGIAWAVLDHYAERFRQMLDGVLAGADRPAGVFAAGGLSRSRAWRQYVGCRGGVEFTVPGTEHPGLLGIARIIERNAPRPRANRPAIPPPGADV